MMRAIALDLGFRLPPNGSPPIQPMTW
jgi:hypothetical protein